MKIHMHMDFLNGNIYIFLQFWEIFFIAYFIGSVFPSILSITTEISLSSKYLNLDDICL